MAQPGKNRTRLQGAFIHALAEDFEEHGRDVIELLRKKHPDRYIAAIASLMPKEIELVRPLEDVTDEQLTLVAEYLRGVATGPHPLAVAADRGSGASPASSTGPAPDVPALPETI